MHLIRFVSSLFPSIVSILYYHPFRQYWTCLLTCIVISIHYTWSHQLVCCDSCYVEFCSFMLKIFFFFFLKFFVFVRRFSRAGFGPRACAYQSYYLISAFSIFTLPLLVFCDFVFILLSFWKEIVDLYCQLSGLYTHVNDFFWIILFL
jgi:hypothetical protein